MKTKKHRTCSISNEEKIDHLTFSINEAKSLVEARHRRSTYLCKDIKDWENEIKEIKENIVIQRDEELEILFFLIKEAKDEKKTSVNIYFEDSNQFCIDELKRRGFSVKPQNDQIEGEGWMVIQW